MEPLSNIELYFSEDVNVNAKSILLTGDEYNHAIKVMRKKPADMIYVTDGSGKIFRGRIRKKLKDHLQIEILEIIQFKNQLANIHFCIPILKNPDRLRFAIEKSVELGITNIVLLETKRSIAKKINLNRLKKICLSAMKQSLRSYLPSVHSKTIDEAKTKNSIRIILEQKAEKTFDIKFVSNKEYYFFFGPEGGFDADEIKLIEPDSIISLGDKRLRSETAIVQTASLINFSLKL